MSVFTMADNYCSPCPYTHVLFLLSFTFASSAEKSRLGKRKERSSNLKFFFVRVCMKLYPQRKQFRFLPPPPSPCFTWGGNLFFPFLSLLSFSELAFSVWKGGGEPLGRLYFIGLARGRGAISAELEFMGLVVLKGTGGCLLLSGDV